MLSKKMLPCIVVAVSLLLLSCPAPYAKGASVQTTSNYWVTVKPTTDSLIYTTVGHNWTISFEALWSYGNDAGQPISNATVTMQVSGVREGEITTLQLNTTSGTFSFNYSSSIADKITFSAIELTTQDGKQWKAALVKSEDTQAYGIQSSPITVWWDTFQVLLTHTDTSTLKASEVAVNVSYLLLPQQGLTLPPQDTFSNQTSLSKIANNANVTINGVKAQETQTPGVYTANISTLFPTEYVLVRVSQKGWMTTYTAFSFSQDENSTVWLQYSLITCSVLLLTPLALYFFLFKRSPHQTSLFDRKMYPLIGGILTLFASLVSLYWGTVAVEATLHGFGWLLLAISGIGSFIVGLVCTIQSIIKKNQTLAILLTTVPMFVNLIVVKSSIDTYSLPIPWLALTVPLLVSITGCILICRADECFSSQTKNIGIN